MQATSHWYFDSLEHTRATPISIYTRENTHRAYSNRRHPLARIVLKLTVDMTCTCYLTETNHSCWYLNSNVNQTAFRVTDSLARFGIFILNPDHYVGFSNRCGTADMCMCLEVDLSKSSLKPSRISLIYSTIRGLGYMCVKRNSLLPMVYSSVNRKRSVLVACVSIEFSLLMFVSTEKNVFLYSETLKNNTEPNSWNPSPSRVTHAELKYHPAFIQLCKCK